MAEKPEKWRETADKAWRDIVRGDPGRANRRLAAVPEEDKARPEIRRLRARAAWLRGFPEAAASILETTLQDIPDDEECRLDLAVLYLYLDRLVDAEATLGGISNGVPSAGAELAAYTQKRLRDDKTARHHLHAAVAALIAARMHRHHGNTVNAPLFPFQVLEN